MYSYWILAFSELYSPHQNQFWDIFITPKRKPVSFISPLLPNTPALVLMFVLCCFSCVLTLCNPVDCSPPGASVHGTLQARILVLVALLFFRGSF